MAPTASASNPKESEGQIANLTVISWAKLLCNDPTENERLLLACTEWGFFYLDLECSETSDYLDVVKGLFGASREFFAKPLEEKLVDMKEPFSLFNVCGYKPSGLDVGNVLGKKDGCEGLRVPVDLVFNPGLDPRLTCPQNAKPYWPLFKIFIEDSYGIAIRILQSLSDSLGMQGEKRFEARHKRNLLSTATGVLQYYPLTDLPADRSVGHFAHTDTGSLTVLFNSDWGLQVHSPRSNTWEYVAPRAGHAIINVGDSLKFMSGHQLSSCLHRVVPSHGRWTDGPRYSTIFFFRANNDAELTDSEGVTWKGSDWLNEKFGNYRKTHEEQQLSNVATGRRGFMGLWEDPQAPEHHAESIAAA